MAKVALSFFWCRARSLETFMHRSAVAVLAMSVTIGAEAQSESPVGSVDGFVESILRDAEKRTETTRLQERVVLLEKDVAQLKGQVRGLLAKVAALSRQVNSQTANTAADHLPTEINGQWQIVVFEGCEANFGTGSNLVRLLLVDQSTVKGSFGYNCNGARFNGTLEGTFESTVLKLDWRMPAREMAGYVEWYTSNQNSLEGVLYEYDLKSTEGDPPARFVGFWNLARLP